jgi:hypothetical protein
LVFAAHFMRWRLTTERAINATAKDAITSAQKTR